MRRIAPLLLFVAVLTAVVAACGTAATPEPLPITLVAPQNVPTSSFTDPRLRRGELIYNQSCGHCHGYNGEGQLAESVPQTQNIGMQIVPAHNASGSTYRFAEDLLIQVIKEGINNPLDQFPMPPFKDTLSDEDINDVLAYIKLWWTPEQIIYHDRVTANLRAARASGQPTPTP
jgi:mono/diheme cytochrome c family protein